MVSQVILPNAIEASTNLGGAVTDVDEVIAGWPVNFDGTNDWLSRGAALTGSSTGKIILFSAWARRLATGVIHSLFTIYNGANLRFIVRFGSGNQIQVIGRSASNASILSTTSTPTYTDTNWHHILASINLASTSQRALWVDGASIASSWGTYVDDSMELNATTVNVGGNDFKFNGDLAELYFHTPATWFDPSVGNNITKFRSAAGKPVYLGTDGSLPLGAQPLVCLNALTTADWHTNVGSGGGFTENGALTDGSAM